MNIEEIKQSKCGSMESSTGQIQQCGLQPSVLFLLGTLLLTSCATAMLCAAIMTDHWEYVTWDQSKVEHIARNTRRNLTAHRQVSNINTQTRTPTL